MALFAAGDDLPLFTGLGGEDPDVMPLLCGEPTAIDETALCECGHVRGRHGLFCEVGGAARDDEPWSWCADCGGLCEFRPVTGAVVAAADDPDICPDCWHEHPEGEPCPPIGGSR